MHAVAVGVHRHDRGEILDGEMPHGFGRTEIEERYGVELPPEELFENPNLNALAAYLYARTQQNVA